MQRIVIKSYLEIDLAFSLYRHVLLLGKELGLSGTRLADNRKGGSAGESKSSNKELHGEQIEITTEIM